MKTLVLLTTFVALLYVNIYSTDIKITIKNYTKQQIEVKFGKISTADAFPKTYNTICFIDSAKEYTFRKKDIDEGTHLFFYSLLTKGGKTKVQEYTVDVDDFREDYIVSINNEDIPVEQNIQDIINGFESYTPTGSSYRESVLLGKENALSTIFGSYMILKDTAIIFRIAPGNLKSTNTTFRGANRNIKLSSDLKREAIVRLNGNIPFTADINLLFGNSEISSFEWDINNAGISQWVPPSSDTEIDLFYKNIDTITKNYLADLFIRDSSLKMFFIDRVYFIESYKLSSSKFEKLSGEAEINVSVFGSGSSNYIRSSSNILELNKNNVISDYYGIDHTDLLKDLAKSRLNSIKNLLSATNAKSEIDYLTSTLREYGSNKELPANKKDAIQVIDDLIKNIDK